MNNNQPLNTQSGDDTSMAVASSSVGDKTVDFGVPSPSDQQLQSQISSLPPEANDVDLIEKEWVLHLKYIVNQTSEDPYKQQAEISKAKADYMRKRYNKNIKVSEN